MKNLILCDNCKVLEVAPLCLQLRAGIEVQAFHDPDVLARTPTALDDHKRAIDGLAPIAVHGCFGDLCPGSFDELVRRVALQRFEESYVVAQRLGAIHLIFHHGYIPHTSSPAGWVDRASSLWRAFLQGKDPGVTIHLENMLEEDPVILADLVRAVDRANFKVNLDIGHAHCYSKTDVVKWIDYLGPLIGYVHLHDNRGEADEHLPLGQGTIPMKDVLQALNAKAPAAIWALEADTTFQQSLDWLAANGFLCKELPHARSSR